VKICPWKAPVIAAVLALTAGSSANAQSLLRCEHGADHEVVSLRIAGNGTGELQDAFGRRYQGFLTVTDARAQGILKITNGAQAIVLFDRLTGTAIISWSSNGGVAKQERTYACAPADKVF